MQYNITYREKDKSIQYIISYKDGTKWRQKAKQGFKTKREAKRAADEALEKLKEESKNSISLDYKDITFKTFCELYMEHVELYMSANTIYQINCCMRDFSNLNDIKMKDIKSLHIQKALDTMVKRGNSQATLEGRIGYLSAIFTKARKQFKIIKENPCEDLVVKSIKQTKDKRALNEHEYKDLLIKMKKTRYYMPCLLAGTCGLRLGEILGLPRNAVDEVNGTIKIYQQWKRLKVKTDTNLEEFGIGEPKSKHSFRTIPVPPATMKELVNYINTNPVQIDGRIFPWGAKHNRNFEGNLNIMLKTKGYNISIHELRHTYATKLIANGVDFKTAAALLGHSIKMTMETYSHVNDDMMDKATLLINNIF